jgi:hypothetical protein
LPEILALESTTEDQEFALGAVRRGLAADLK